MNRWHKLVFGLIFTLPILCFGQTPDQFTLQIQNGGVPVYTRSNFAALNLTGSCSGTVSGGALAITCTGGAANPGGSANQIEYNVAGTSFGGFTMSGDCSIVVSTGVITCTKTNGTAFGALATAATPLSVANGGNGTATPALIAGTNITLSGTWPAITINSTAGGGGLSGMTAGQVPIAATANTVTSSEGLAGSGAGITTGPTSVTSGHVADFTGSGGQIADSGVVAANVVVASSPGAGIARFAGSTQTETSAELSGDVTTSGSNSATVVGLKTVPFCTGFTPTNGQSLEYTTGSSPNPCYTAVTVSGGGNVSTSGTITSGQIPIWASGTAIKSAAISGDETLSSSGVAAVVGINSVPLCTGFSPTNGQVVEYTTGSSPNPCYTAATVSGSGTPGGSLYAIQVNNPSGTFGGLNAPTTPPLVPQVVESVPTSGSAATAYVNALPGLLGRPVTGTTNSDTILATDCDPARVEYIGSVSVAVTLPTATSLGVPNCQTKLANNTTGTNSTVTITPTTWTINGLTSLTLLQGQQLILSVDPNSSTNWVADQIEDNLVAGSNVTFVRSPTAGLTLSVVSLNASFLPQTTAVKLGTVGNPFGDLRGSQTASGDDVIHYDCTSNPSNTGLLINLIGFPASAATAFSVDCVTGNTNIAGTATVGGGETVNGAAGITVPNGPVSTGATTVTGAMLPSGVTGAWGCAEGSTAGTPTAGGDYLRCDSTQHTILMSVNGGAEAPIVGSNLKIRECDISLGNGLNAIPAGTYPIVGCKNDTGSTLTITAVQCYMNGGSTSTCDATTSAAGTPSILTGAVTGSSSFAAGTQSSTTTLATGKWLNGSLVADGTSTQIILHVVSTL